MDANFVITKKLILACWACSHRGKNGLTDQKIEIFKVHDIDTIIHTLSYSLIIFLVSEKMIEAFEKFTHK